MWEPDDIVHYQETCSGNTCLTFITIMNVQKILVIFKSDMTAGNMVDFLLQNPYDSSI